MRYYLILFFLTGCGFFHNEMEVTPAMCKEMCGPYRVKSLDKWGECECSDTCIELPKQGSKETK